MIPCRSVPASTLSFSKFMNLCSLKHENTVKKPHGYWNNLGNIERFISNIQEKYKCNTKSEWKEFSTKQLIDEGGRSLLKQYSLAQIICKCCPELKQEYSNIIKKENGWWDDKNNIKTFLLQVQEKYKFDDWNLLTREQILSMKGSRLLQKYSLFELKCLICPELENKFLENKKKPKGWWENDNNVQSFIDKLKENLSLKSVEDWNELTTKKIQNEGGRNLLKKYTLFQIKKLGCDEIEKYSHFGKNQPKYENYWEIQENIDSFLQLLQDKYKLNSIDDWNRLTRNQVQLCGGSGLLLKFNLFEIKCMGSPEIKEKYSKNIIKPHGYWNKQENIKNFLNQVKDKFDIVNNSDWTRVSVKQLISMGGGSLFVKYSLYDLLCIAFPKENWNKVEFSKKDKRSQQRWLFLQVKKIYPSEEIIEDYFHGELSRISGCAVQFDVFIPSKNIAFEYQGQQHYLDIPTAFGPIEMYQLRDSEKKAICKKFDIHQIIIPHWWDNSVNQLRNFIHNK